MLLEAGSAVEAKVPGDGSTPLHYASHAGCNEMVEVLLAAGAKVDVPRIFEQQFLGTTTMGGDGATALLVACETMSMSVGAAVAMARADGKVEPSKAAHVAVVRALLEADAAGAKELAAQVSTRLSVPDARVKIKTLQLILNTLTSPHRTPGSKFRPAIQSAAQEFIASLVEFECEPDPQFGDKPAKIVRNTHSRRNGADSKS